MLLLKVKEKAEEAHVAEAVSAPDKFTVLPVTQVPLKVKELKFDLNGEAAGVVMTGAAGGAAFRVHWKLAAAEVLFATSVCVKE